MPRDSLWLMLGMLLTTQTLTETANAAILRLTKEMECMKEVLKQEHCLRTNPPSTYADRVFENEIYIAVNRTEKNYQDYMFREALNTGV